MGFKSKRVLRGVLGLLASVSLPQVTKASDLMIWSPVKVAPRTYKTTLGFRLPMAWDVSAGMDLGLGSAATGAILGHGNRRSQALFHRMAPRGVIEGRCA
jgi:hypothetical protein